MSRWHRREPGGCGADQLWDSWRQEGDFPCSIRMKVGGVKQETRKAWEENANQERGLGLTGIYVLWAANKSNNK